MKQLKLIALAAAAAAAVSCTGGKEAEMMKKITPVNSSDVKITDNFRSPRLKSHQAVTLGVCIKMVDHMMSKFGPGKKVRVPLAE